MKYFHIYVSFELKLLINVPQIFLHCWYEGALYWMGFHALFANGIKFGTHCLWMDIFPITSNLGLSMWMFLLQAWPDDALELVANTFLEDVELSNDVRVETVGLCKRFHIDVRELSEK